MLDLQEAYTELLQNPNGCVTHHNENRCSQYFIFEEAPKYTPAYQEGRRVMQEVRVWTYDDDPLSHVEEPRNHWGFLYPPDNSEIDH